jgi:hypothetical protein
MRDILVTVVKPIIISVATHPSVKKMVVELLEKYVRTTDNSIDDVVLALVKDRIFKPQR